MENKKRKKLKNFRMALGVTKVWQGMIVHMCTIVFWVLNMICVLVVAGRAVNAVAQLCKMVSHPSKCVLTFRCNCKGQGHHVVSKVWTCPVLCQVR